MSCYEMLTVIDKTKPVSMQVFVVLTICLLSRVIHNEWKMHELERSAAQKS